MIGKNHKVYKDATRALEYPYNIEEVKTLVMEWIADGELTLLDIEVAPSHVDRESPNYCMFHRHTKHPTSECWMLRRIFKKKLDNNELRIATKAQDVRVHPYPEHGTANMVECFDFLREIEEDDYDYSYDYDHEVYMTSFYDGLDGIAGYEIPTVATPALKSGVKILQNCTKFRQFYDGMGFTPNTRLRMKKAILAIAQEGHEACAAEGGSLPRMIKDESNTISFSDSDRRVLHPHNKPLYVIARVNGVDKKESLGYVIVDLAVGLIRTATKFHIIDAQTNYHIILGCNWSTALR